MSIFKQYSRIVHCVFVVLTGQARHHRHFTECWLHLGVSFRSRYQSYYSYSLLCLMTCGMIHCAYCLIHLIRVCYANTESDDVRNVGKHASPNRTLVLLFLSQVLNSQAEIYVLKSNVPVPYNTEFIP